MKIPGIDDINEGQYKHLIGKTKSEAEKELKGADYRFIDYGDSETNEYVFGRVTMYLKKDVIDRIKIG
jgi:hypothetical protein